MIKVMSLSANDLQGRLPIPLRCLHGILHRHRVVLVSVDQQDGAREAIDGVLHMDGLRGQKVAFFQGQSFDDRDLVRNVGRIEGMAEHEPGARAFGDHERRGAEDQAPDSLRCLRRGQRRRETALGVPGEPDLRDPVLLFRPTDGGQGIGYPMVQRMFTEFPAALAVAVQVHPQRRESGFAHGLAGSDAVGPVFAAGEAVQEDHQGTRPGQRPFQDCAQPDSAICDGHGDRLAFPLHPVTDPFAEKSCPVSGPCSCG